MSRRLGVPSNSWSMVTCAAATMAALCRPKSRISAMPMRLTARTTVTTAAHSGYTRKIRPIQNVRTQPRRSSDAGMM